jgi:hypothetical protein
MSAEYIFAATLDEAAVLAKAQGWRKAGRSGFIKPDGTVVHFIFFEQQIDALPTGAVVHRFPIEQGTITVEPRPLAVPLRRRRL